MIELNKLRKVRLELKRKIDLIHQKLKHYRISKGVRIEKQKTVDTSKLIKKKEKFQI